VDKSQPPILLVANGSKEAAALRTLLGLPDAIDTDPQAAGTFLGSSVLGGMVVGAEVASWDSRPLVQSYLKHQPCGRIVILTSSGDLTTLAAYLYRLPRVELFIAPWDAAELRAFLHVEALASV